MRKMFTLFLAACMVFGVGMGKDTIAYAQSNASGTTNLIKGGDFENGLGIWGHFTTLGGKGSVAVNNGKLVADVEDTGSEAYSMQVYYDDFKLYEKGEYVLEFEVSSTINRNIFYRIQLKSGDYRGYIEDEVALTSDVKTVRVAFTMTDETDELPRLAFNIGNVDGKLGRHQVKIDNVQLYLVDDSNVEYGEDEVVIEDKNIILNQVGYKPDDTKKIVFKACSTQKKFKVVSTTSNEVVYEGDVTGSQYNTASRENTASGDFTTVTTPGKYKIVVDGLGESYPFEIGETVYDALFKDAFKMFYMQRCGEVLDGGLAGKWAHGSCHTSLAKIYGTNEYIDVSGGWHDAGDYGRYVVATSKTIADLLLAYKENPKAFGDDLGIPESGNGVSDVLDEVRGQLDWLFKMQNEASGGVYHKVTCAAFPGYVMPEDETAELIVSPISTTATADFTAVMAMAYETYKEIDISYANKCLEKAEKAWGYLMQAPSSNFVNPPGIETGEYGDTSDRDERYWAAAQLFKATGKTQYHETFKNYANQKIETGLDWGCGGVGNYGNIAYLKATGVDGHIYDKVKSAIVTEANAIMALAQSDSYGVSHGVNYYWGSNMSALNNAMVLLTAYSMAPNELYKVYAKEQINYCLGKNAMGMSFVTGYGTVAPQNPHHRPSIAKKEAIKGMLVGGPNSQLEDNYAKIYLQDAAPAKCYLDHVESYSTNEVDIYWNSPLVSMLAQLELIGNANSEGGNEGSGESGGNQGGDQGGDIVGSDKVEVKVVTDINSSVNQVYTVSATNDQVIDLSKLVIRYYFTKENTKEMNFWCDNAAVQLNEAPWYKAFNSTMGVFGSDEKGTYLEIKVDENFGLKPGVGTLKLQVRLAHYDWSPITCFEEEGIVVLYNGKVM